MTDVETSLLFISVLFLVVITLGDRTYDIDTSTIANAEGTIIGFPNLGRFTIIHSVNSLILVIGYWVVLADVMVVFDARLIIMLLHIGSIYAMLPILESQSYDQLMIEGEYPKSLITHMYLSFVQLIIIPILLILFELFGNLHPIIDYSEYSAEVIAFLFTLYYLASVHSFLSDFQDDIQKRKIPKTDEYFQ